MAPGCRGLVVPIFGDADAAAGRAVPAGVLAARSGAGDPAGGGARGDDHQHQRRAVRAGGVGRADPGRRGAIGRSAAASWSWRRPATTAANARTSPPRCRACWPSARWMHAAGRWPRATGAPPTAPTGLLAPGAGLLAARAGGGHSVVAGTSFATAIVSGAAALLAQPGAAAGPAHRRGPIFAGFCLTPPGSASMIRSRAAGTWPGGWTCSRPSPCCATRTYA